LSPIPPIACKGNSWLLLLIPCFQPKDRWGECKWSNRELGIEPWLCAKYALYHLTMPPDPSLPFWVEEMWKKDHT
jgi:hypothetical protein